MDAVMGAAHQLIAQLQRKQQFGNAGYQGDDTGGGGSRHMPYAEGIG